MQTLQDPMIVGPCSDMEYVILSTSLDYIAAVDEAQDIPKQLKEAYDAVRYMAQTMAIDIPLFDRTIKDMETFLSKYKFNKYVYLHM